MPRHYKVKISEPEIQQLLTLWNRDHVPVERIASRIGIRPISVNSFIDKLRKKGFPFEHRQRKLRGLVL